MHDYMHSYCTYAHIRMYMYDNLETVKNNSMRQSPWEANCHSATKEITHLLWNMNIHYRVRNSPPLQLILSQLNLVQMFTLHSLR
jgi:hypothetical protein